MPTGHIAKVNTDEIIKLYQEGYSCNQIAKQIGYSESVVRSRLKKSNIPMRTRQESLKKHYEIEPKITPMITKTCINCNTTFNIKKSRQNRKRFCSISCSSKWYHKHKQVNRKTLLPPLLCKECGQEFYVSSKYKLKTQKFCSVECAKYYKHVQGHRYANTNIERIIQAMLIGMKINFETHWRLDPFSADIYLTDYHKAIECDGDYWHSLPQTKQTDTRKSKAFSKAKIPVLHLTESEIIKEQKQCYTKILNFIKSS